MRGNQSDCATSRTPWTVRGDCKTPDYQTVHRHRHAVLALFGMHERKVNSFSVYRLGVARLYNPCNLTYMQMHSTTWHKLHQQPSCLTQSRQANIQGQEWLSGLQTPT